MTIICKSHPRMSSHLTSAAKVTLFSSPQCQCPTQSNTIPNRKVPVASISFYLTPKLPTIELLGAAERQSTVGQPNTTCGTEARLRTRDKATQLLTHSTMAVTEGIGGTGGWKCVSELCDAAVDPLCRGMTMFDFGLLCGGLW